MLIHSQYVTEGIKLSQFTFDELLERLDREIHSQRFMTKIELEIHSLLNTDLDRDDITRELIVILSQLKNGSTYVSAAAHTLLIQISELYSKTVEVTKALIH